MSTTPSNPAREYQPKIAHAPLPWTSVANSWQYATIYDADNLPVCRFDLEDWPVTEDNQDQFEKAQAEVVALVVDAVNSHATLKARVNELQVAAQALIDEIAAGGTHQTWKRLSAVLENGTK